MIFIQIVELIWRVRLWEEIQGSKIRCAYDIGLTDTDNKLLRPISTMTRGVMEDKTILALLVARS